MIILQVVVRQCPHWLNRGIVPFNAVILRNEKITWQRLSKSLIG